MPSDSIVSIPEPLTRSRIYRGLREARAILADSIPTSAIGKSIIFLGEAVRQSWLYRWLTKEPEPEVIVIDLRETWTVGPVIRILDWGLGSVESAYSGSQTQQLVSSIHHSTLEAPIRVMSGGLLVASGLYLMLAIGRGGTSSLQLVLNAAVILGAVAGLFIDVSWAELRDTRFVQLLIRALEPPEPPEE